MRRPHYHTWSDTTREMRHRWFLQIQQCDTCGITRHRFQRGGAKLPWHYHPPMHPRDIPHPLTTGRRNP